MNFDEHKQDIQAFFAQQYGLHIEIYGHIKPTLFPTPHVTIQSVHIRDSAEDTMSELRAEELDIYLGITGLLHLDKWSKITEIELKQGQIQLDSLAQFDSLPLFKQEKLPAISLINVSLSVGEHCLDCVSISHLLIDWGKDNDFSELKADFETNKIPYNLDIHFTSTDEADTKVVSATLKGSAFEWSAGGTLKGQLDKIDHIAFEGHSSCNIANFRNFMRDFSSTSLDSHDAHHDSSHSSLLKDFAVSITSPISIDNGFVYFTDLSTVIHNTTFKPKLLIDLIEKEISLDIKIDQITLNDLLYLEQETNPFAFVQSAIEYFQHESSTHATDLAAFSFDINIKKINLSKSESNSNDMPIEDLILSGDIIDGNVAIHKGEAKFPGNSKIEISGATSWNGIRPKFDAHLTLSIEDFKSLSADAANLKQNIPEAIFLKTDISIFPHRVRVSKLRAALEKILMIGNFSILNDATNKKSVIGSVRFNRIDLDKFGADKLLDDFIFLLFKSDSDKTGKTYFKLMNDYKWLRYLSFSLDTDIVAEQLIFKQQEFDHCLASLSMAPGMIAANDVSLRSNILSLDGGFSLSLPGFKPKIQSSIHLHTLDTKFFDIVLPSMNALLEKQSPNKNITDTEKDQINLFSINHFDGNVNLQADQIIHKDQTIKNVKLDLQVVNGIVLINNLEADAFSGKFKLVGNISAVETVFPTTIGFALNNIDPGILLKKLTGIEQLKGYMSLSGSASTSGINWTTAKQMLQANIVLAGKNIVWTGFDLDKIISAAGVKWNKNDRTKYLDYYTKNGNSFFKDLSGTITIRHTIADLENIKLLSNRASGVMVARYNILNNMASAASRFSFIPSGYTTPLFLQTQSSGSTDKLQTTFDLTQLTNFTDQISSTSGQVSTPSAVSQTAPSSIRDVGDGN